MVRLNTLSIEVKHYKTNVMVHRSLNCLRGSGDKKKLAQFKNG